MINTIKVGTSEHSIVPVLSERVWGNYPENPLRLGTSMSNDMYGLTIAMGSGITAGAGGLYVDAQHPLVADDYGLSLKLKPDSSGLASDVDGLQVKVGGGLVVGAYGIDIKLKNYTDALRINGGLELVIGSDLYTDGTESHNRSLALSYGLRLLLSNCSMKEGTSRIEGSALCSSEYGLTLALGTSLTVEDNFLKVALSGYTLLKKDGEMVRAIPHSSLGVAFGGQGQGGLALCLNLRDIRGNGILQSLLTVDEGGALDIDVEALKYVLGLS